MGANIGRASLRVFIRSRSPFSAQPKQEVAHFFRSSTFKALKPNKITSLPDPIRGIRNREKTRNYDNFLQDLGETFFDEEAAASGRPLGTPDALATIRRLNATTSLAQRGGEISKANQEAEKSKRTKTISAEQQEYFTWAVSNNLFLVEDDADPAINPPPVPPDEVDGLQEKRRKNIPEWTYFLLARPGGDDKARMLTPFMKKSAPNDSLPIHWGVKTKIAIAKNQPFEMTYYFLGRDPAIAEKVKELGLRFKFQEVNGAAINLRLTKSLYFALEFGIGTSDGHFILIFKNDSNPMLFRVFPEVDKEGKANGGLNAFLVSTFNKVSASKVFDPNHKFFTVSIEPVIGSFIIRSNVFDVPWVISGSNNDPFSIGKGHLSVYGGNVQAGFAFRPLQYERSGSFQTPEKTFIVLSEGAMPRCSTATKGSGDIEQDRSYDGDDGTPQVHMVDAELVNGAQVKTIVDNSSKESRESGVIRKIDTELLEISDPNVNPDAQDNPRTDVTQERVERTFVVNVKLTSGHVKQGNKFIVQNGRSPYIWMVRCQGDTIPGGQPKDIIDISCDVMSIDLAWNATSYNEFSHTGTMRVLNRRQSSAGNPRPPIDYREFTNRAVYIRIEAWWDGGAGFDPGKGNRQIFEGMTLGAEISTQAEREVVTFRLEDYMNALQGSKFVLSPFYDGMKASLAVRDIVRQMGLGDDRILTNDGPIGRAGLANDLGLPFSNPLEEPLFRFKDGSSYKEGVLRIAKLDFKAIYFDRFGRFHYDTIPGGIFANQAIKTKARFWSSPIESQAAGDNAWDVDSDKLAWNVVSFGRLVNDVYNVIQVYGVDKRLLSRLSGATAYKAGISDPNAIGYLGYRKHLMIKEAALGSIDALFRYLDNYRRRVFIPPLNIKFEVYGRSDLKPLDIIEVDGQRIRILNISIQLSAAENQYWMNIEGEWFFSAGKIQDPRLTSDENAAVKAEDAALKALSPGSNAGSKSTN